MLSTVVFLATAWGSRYGGINSFNQDLCSALAALVTENGGKVICVVATATEDEAREALRDDVELIILEPGENAATLGPERAYEVVARAEQHSPEWWIGHDVITGPVALQSRALAGGKAAIVHHMNYEAYLPYHTSAPMEKVELQRQVLTDCDVAFAVGPKLLDSAREKLRPRPEVQVKELTPGLAKITGLEQPSRFSAIAFGRLDPSNDRVKQARLAVAAFGRACGLAGNPLGNDASLTVIGLHKEAQAEERLQLKELLDKEANRAVPLHGWPFLEDREALLDHLRHHSVCMMLSLHEGFGLVGWEAIAAEVPLVVSQNTGLHEAVWQCLGGVGRGCMRPVPIRGATVGESYREEDVDAVAQALVDVRTHASEAKRDAQVLKGLLQLACTWEHTALQLASGLRLKPARDLPGDNLSQWTPELLIEALKKGSDVVEEASRRRDYFSHIWRRMAAPAEVQQRLILFGGVSQSLCTPAAASRFASWLLENPQAHLFLCYEADEAAAARAGRLDEDSLETASGLPSQALERMIQKQKRVERLPELIASAANNNAAISARLHLVRIRRPLSTYVIIADQEVYLTPLFEKRASESLSFTLSEKPSMVHEVVSSVLFHLENVEPPGEKVDHLAAELRSAFTPK